MPNARSRSVTTESQREILRHRPGDIVRDGRRADAALGADHGDDPADRLGVGRREQSADRAHHVERADRRDHVVADAAPDQLAVEHDVVGAADDDDARSGVAELGQRVEAGQNGIAAAFRLQHDDVGRRRAAIGFDGGGDAAHLDFDMRLAETAVFAGRLDGGRGFHRFAERLDRDARRRRDVLVARRRLRRALRLRCDGLECGSDHLPRSLIAPLLESG